MLYTAAIILILILGLIYTEIREPENHGPDHKQERMDCEVISIVNRRNPEIIVPYLDCRASIELRWIYWG